MTDFDAVDTEEGYTNWHTLGMCNGTTFSDFSGWFRVLAPTDTGSGRAFSPGTGVVLEVVQVAENAIIRLSCMRCTLVRWQRTGGYTPSWMLYGGLLVTKGIIRHLPSTTRLFFTPVFSTAALLSAPLGHWPADHGRGQA